MNEKSKINVEKVLDNKVPDRIVYSPNYWQWFTHQKNHGLLDDEIKHCRSQYDILSFLGVDIFSRNIYGDDQIYWWGGICDEYFENGEFKQEKEIIDKNIIYHKKFIGKSGELSDELTFRFDASTLIQNKFFVDDYETQFRQFEEFVSARRWRFNPEKYKSAKEKYIGAHIVLGEVISPLKMLHLTMGPVNSVYFLMMRPDEAKAVLQMHENAMLDVVRECASYGVKTIMSMDNLDTPFHPPEYVENYCASFYEKASSICHEYGSKFFIHACGHQEANLKLISSLKVDGLEGVAFPPVGDIDLEKVMSITPDNFIITGGLSAVETERLCSRREAFEYVEEVFRKMRPYSNRFIFASSCNTSINAKWETIKNIRDAWLVFR